MVPTLVVGTAADVLLMVYWVFTFRFSLYSSSSVLLGGCVGFEKRCIRDGALSLSAWISQQVCCAGSVKVPVCVCVKVPVLALSKCL